MPRDRSTELRRNDGAMTRTTSKMDRALLRRDAMTRKLSTKPFQIPFQIEANMRAEFATGVNEA
jgi:hypothetical protein